MTTSGGRSSPSQSRPLTVTQIVLVLGLTAIPTALRRPLTKVLCPLPSGLYSVTAARRGSFSKQTLQLDPAETYILSPWNSRVRVECPPLPGRSVSVVGLDARRFASSQL